jgi:catechol 2,3-dioxygenase-like lactoylglutathione lyase family enzyme
MNKVAGLHHLAICTANMKEQIEFFTDKLGMELQALYWMHGVENTWHGFLRLNDESSIAFVCNPDIEKIPREPRRKLCRRCHAAFGVKSQ